MPQRSHRILRRVFGRVLVAVVAVVVLAAVFAGGFGSRLLTNAGDVTVAVLLLVSLAGHYRSWRKRRQVEDELRWTCVDLDRRVEERTAELDRINAAFEKEVHDRREAARSLRESEVRWRAVSGLTSDWAYCYRGKGGGSLVLDWVTESCTRATGFTVEELRARGGLIGLVHPDDRTKVQTRVYTGWEVGLDGRETRIVTKSGEVRWVLDHGPLVWDDPETGVAQLYGAVQDVTERKTAEDALRRSERELADFFDNGAIPLHWTGPDGRIVRANQAELDLLGYAREDYVGRYIAEFHVDRGVVDDIQRRIANKEAVHDQPARLRCADGSIKHVIIDKNAMWENGSLVHTRCFTRDVSQITRMEEENRRYYLEAEQARQRAEQHVIELGGQAVELETARNAALDAVQAKSAFLANMSHEIRTPMTAILGYTNLLAEPATSESERQSHLATIRRNGEQLLRIINDILDLSKIEAGKLVFERIVCEVVELVEEVASLMRARAVEKGLAFAVEYRPDVPRAVRTDPTRLRQILLNLLGNAIKFTRRGGVRLVVGMVESPGGEPRLSFEVIDSGIGISEDVAATLFTPFTQADASTTRRFGGTGLGLSISKRLAQLMGGDITFHGRPGAGSTFVLLAGAEPVAEDALSPTEPRAEDGGHPGARKTAPRLTARILLAEDTPDNQRLIHHHLRKAGAQVEVADNGRIACETVTAGMSAGVHFDAILMDMQMPEVDGYAATHRLREVGYAGPIIALTAYATASDRLKCLDAGCDDFLSKPIESDVLIETLHHHLAGQPPLSDGASALSAFESTTGMAELVEMFVSGLTERVAGLERALAASDREDLARLAHQLKGTAGGYGFPTITEAAAALHGALRAGQVWDEICMRTDDVIRLCRGARATPGGVEPASGAAS